MIQTGSGFPSICTSFELSKPTKISTQRLLFFAIFEALERLGIQPLIAVNYGFFRNVNFISKPYDLMTFKRMLQTLKNTRLWFCSDFNEYKLGRYVFSQIVIEDSMINSPKILPSVFWMCKNHYLYLYPPVFWAFDNIQS